MPNYIKQLDAFRFFAFFGVFIAHLVKIDNPILAKLPFGYGVNLFYVLSGFLITRLLMENRFNSGLPRKSLIKNFYIKRSLRIFPIYYGTIIFLYLIQFQNYQEATPWMLSYAANIHISLSLPYLGSYNHLWSLGVEEQFYLIWPFVILFVPERHLLKTICFFIVVSVFYKTGLYLFNGGWHPAINASTISCMDAFGMGALIAYWDRYDKEAIKSMISKKWILISVLIIFTIFIIYPRVPSFPYINEIYGNFLFSIIAFYLLMPATQDAYKGVFKKIIENKLIIHLGKISYGLYLYHLFMPDLYNYIIEKGFSLPPLGFPRYCISFVMCLTISELSWFIVEQPINRIKKKYDLKRNPVYSG
jgi:peptidoglycan/LPS O-acetylase OafA/YrhL